MEIFCIGVFSLELLVIFYLLIGKGRIPKLQDGDQITAISFVIPFHNEQDRILPLIQSINASDYSGKCEFIFVDDYSTDETVQILKNQLKVPYRLTKNQEKKGKKRAIHKGVTAAKYKFIITWDADINFKPNYIQNLFDLPVADLIVLPVQMTSSTLAGKLASIEFSFIETFNLGFSGFRKPIACNGANLGFKKSAFLALRKVRTDYDIPSGDDLFLLWAMLKADKEISIYKNKSVAVSTEAPATFLAVIKQRKRWKGKMKSPVNFETALPVILQFLVMMASGFTIILGLQQPQFFFLFLLKFLIELLASWSFIKQHYSHFFLLILHQVWYPLYAVVLVGIPFSKEKRWT
jgi:glycosyltransferase involved in cell wall biosynthesis